MLQPLERVTCLRQAMTNVAVNNVDGGGTGQNQDLPQKRQTASAVLSLLLLACLYHPSRETRGDLCLCNRSCVAWTPNSISSISIYGTSENGDSVNLSIPRFL